MSMYDSSGAMIEFADETTVSAANLAHGIYLDKLRSRAPFLRRLWFVVSCIPRYLISGSVKVP